MRIIVTEEEICTSRYHSGEQFGDWEEHYSYDVVSARVANDDAGNSYGEEGYMIPDGSTEVHVIYMIYDTGDSFGSAYGRGAILGAFGNREVAEKALEEIEKQAKLDKYSIEVEDDFKRKIKLSNPGAGYFESVNSINLRTFNLKSPNVTIKF